MARIAVVHVPYYSHINALTRLTAILTRQGHEVIAWAPEPCRQRIEAAGATLVEHDPDMPRVFGFMGFVAALARTTEVCSRVLIEQLYVRDVDVIIHDSQTPWARVAGDYLGIPRIVSHPMFPIISNGHIASPEDVRQLATPPAEARERFEESWLAIAQRWGVELGDWHNVIHSQAEGQTTVTYTTRDILGEYEPAEDWHFVGPLMEPPPQRTPRGERPLVYVCFGTSFNARVEQFKVVVEGLADEPVDVLVSTGAGVITEEHLAPLPKNVAVREFVPGRDMLARADVHMTHGGCNSVHETLLAGVPMLCMPQAWDQFPLAGRVQELGAGRMVAEDPESIRDGLRAVLDDPGITARAAELGRHLTEYDGDGALAGMMEDVLAEDVATAA